MPALPCNTAVLQWVEVDIPEPGPDDPGTDGEVGGGHVGHWGERRSHPGQQGRDWEGHRGLIGGGGRGCGGPQTILEEAGLLGH